MLYLEVSAIFWILISLYQKAEYQTGRERSTSEDPRYDRGLVLLKVQDTKIGSNLWRENDRKKSFKNPLENKVLNESIDPSGGLICRQKNKQTNKQHG